MHTLTEKELKTLIKLEAEGKLTPDDLYRRVALKTVQNQDNYVGSAIAHIVIGCICVGLAGQMVAPVFLLLWGYSWFKSYRTRLESIRRINAGEFVDYLEPSDRISYEKDFAGQTVQAIATPSQATTEAATEAATVTPPSDEQTAPGTVIGSDTKLGAIAVPAVAVEPGGEAGREKSLQQLQDHAKQALADFHDPSPNPALSVEAQDAEVDIPNIAEDLGRNPFPSLIVGIPGSGKGIFHSNAIRSLTRINPKYRRVGIDPKNDPKEDGYWEGYHHVCRRRIDKLSPDQVAAWVNIILDEWDKIPAPKIMVWDELALTVAMLERCKEKTVFNRFKTFIIAIISNGHSREEILWAVSQNAHCENIGFNGGLRGNFRAVALVASHNRAAVSSLTSTDFVGKISSEALESVFLKKRLNQGQDHDRWIKIDQVMFMR
jgi:hypothetical protein